MTAEHLEAGRDLVLEKANEFRFNHGHTRHDFKPLRKKHIHQAVNICRRYKLVSAEAMSQAGFNPRGLK